MIVTEWTSDLQANKIPAGFTNPVVAAPEGTILSTELTLEIPKTTADEPTAAAGLTSLGNAIETEVGTNYASAVFGLDATGNSHIRATLLDYRPGIANAVSSDHTAWLTDAAVVLVCKVLCEWSVGPV